VRPNDGRLPTGERMSASEIEPLYPRRRAPYRGRAALLALVVALCAVVLPCAARGEPIRLLSPSVVVTEGGSRLELPPGVFLSEPEWKRLDEEVRRLQDSETRLQAERDSYRESASGHGWVGWVSAFAAGVAAGYLLTR
jgi:hypothetical protein